MISGDPGAGKSAYGVKLAEMYAKNDKRKIYSTYWIDVPGLEVVTWPEMRKLQKAVCIVDESADLFNARDYAKGDNKEQLNHFREHRKDGLTLFLVSQGFEFLDTNIRQMTRYVWHVHRLFGPDFYENESKLEQIIGVWSRAKMYLAKTYTKESEGHKKRICLRTSLFRVDSLYDRFDTLAKSAGLHGDKNTRGAGLAAGSELASERRAERAGKDRLRLPPWVYPLMGCHPPKPRPVAMPFTREEYLSWAVALDAASNGRTEWRGPVNVAGYEGYDRLPEELQVHAVGGKMPMTGGQLLPGGF